MPIDDDKPSERQEAWEDIALRLRMQVVTTLTIAERQVGKADDPETAYIDPSDLERLVNTAWHAFALERQTATMDQSIRREAGWG